MLEIAICDDEKCDVASIENMLENISINNAVKIDVDVFYDGKTLVDFINKGKRYDIIYLDIEMLNQNGVDAGKAIRRMDNKVIIIYVTSYESFAKEVFEVSAFRFITKPIDFSVFKKYFMDAKNEIFTHPKYFQYQYNRISYRVPIDEILYFQSEKRLTYIVTNSSVNKCYCKLNDIENSLGNSGVYFYRTHQSFLVNPQYVSMYMYDTMELMDGTVLTVSENRRKSVNKLFCTLKGADIIV